MEPTVDQLRTIAAIVEYGTFEAAARSLHVTTSAVSQRVRALESMAGQVLVRRSTPCTATVAGERLVRLARQTELLHAETRAALAAEQGTVRLPVAVNADSLATWFHAVIGEVATWSEVELRLRVEDQGWSADLLRRGEVLAAITSDAEPVQGCSVERLGVLRYLPAASPRLAERWRTGRGPDWARMPVVVFNDKDRLQHDFLAARGVDAPRVVHRVPTSADFVTAIRVGLGWGLVPEPQMDDGLVLLNRRARVEVVLHWQRWRLDSPVLERLTRSVRSAATALR